MRCHEYEILPTVIGLGSGVHQDHPIGESWWISIHLASAPRETRNHQAAQDYTKSVGFTRIEKILSCFCSPLCWQTWYLKKNESHCYWIRWWNSRAIWSLLWHRRRRLAPSTQPWCWAMGSLQNVDQRSILENVIRGSPKPMAFLCGLIRWLRKRPKKCTQGPTWIDLPHLPSGNLT